MLKDDEYTKSFKMINKLFPKLKLWIYQTIPDSRMEKKIRYKMVDIVVLDILKFLFRYRSLNAFVLEFKNNQIAIENLKKYFKIHEIPDEETIKNILSLIPTTAMNQLLRKLNQRIERKKITTKLKFMEKYELLSIDGSGQFSSYKISCPKCTTKKIDGKTLYMHSQLVATLVSTCSKSSFTLQYEPIENNKDGEYVKNDCELNAAKRLLDSTRRSFPKRSFCVLGDNLYAVVPFISKVEEYNWKFIITAKPERNKELFSWYDLMEDERKHYQKVDNDGHIHRYSWYCQIPLRQENRKDKHYKVNILEYTEYDKDGEQLFHSTWITNIELNIKTVNEVAQGGRSRFLIENKTFNEQKNLGFQTTHNFGHFENLPSVFFGLAQIAHTFSQFFSFWKVGKSIIKKVGSSRRFWERFAVLFSSIKMNSSIVPIIYLKFEFDSS